MNNQSDIYSRKTYKPVADFLTSLDITDHRVVVFRQQNIKSELEWEIAQQEVIRKPDSVKYSLNQDYQFLAHYED